MIYSFNGVQRRAVEKYGLKSSDFFCLKYAKDVMLLKKTLRLFEGKRIYYYINFLALKKAMPFIGSIRVIERTFKKYLDKGILLRVKRTKPYKGKLINNYYYCFPKEVFTELFSRR